MRLDHVSYAVGADDLARTVQWLGSQLCSGFSDGGLHPRFGTRNFVLPLAGGCYLEVVSALDHPAVDKAPFGQVVKRRAELGGGWLGWVIAVDDIAPIETRLGRPAVEGSRHRPDGFELRWKQIGVMDTMDDPQRPFFVQWLGDRAEHPGASGGRVRIEKIEFAGDPADLASWANGSTSTPLDEIEVTWVDKDAADNDPGIVAVHFSTRQGTVRID